MEQTVFYKGHVIEIKYDQGSLHPLRDWDNFGTVSCFHRNYELSSKDNPFDDIEELQEHIKSKDVVSLPLYLYDHSGITISTTPFSCHWDSGQVGYIHATKDEIRKEYGAKKITKKTLEKVYNLFRAQIRTFDNYLTGQVYGFNIYKENDEERSDSLDSCWGFFGSDHEESGLLGDARHAVDDLLIR
jgi:hypothetical protein